MLYSSEDNFKIKELKKLKQKKYRDKTNLYLVEGEHLVKEAYKKGILKELIISDSTFSLDVDTITVTNNIMNSLSDVETPPKIIGVCEKEENNIIGNKILVLDDIQDPGNLGSIIRSAVAFNIDTVVLGLNSVDLYNSKVLRATQGMNFHINIVKQDLEEVIKTLKQEQYHIYGTKVTNGKDIKTLEKKSKFVIIMGNEGNGIKEHILNMCDEFLYIQVNSKCESLNVGVAASIILYELDRLC